ncbi:MAG: multidrug efflux SMR transporter [Rhizobiales bacterium]|nr:multidrug efflux SMR transporter [Hyphomicrobiales bacterium]
MGWVFLLIAGVFEVAATTAFRFTDNFTRFWPCIVFIALVAASMLTLLRAIETIPLGTAYAVWTGIGAGGTAVLGVLYFGEPATFLRGFFLMMLIGSIIGLKLVSAH